MISFIENSQVLPPERTEKLKIFAIVGLRKDVPVELVQNKITLSLVCTYNINEAVLGAIEGIRQTISATPGDYILPYIHLAIDADKIIKVPEINPLEEKLKEIQSVDKQSQKSKENIISYIRLAFDTAGTDDEKKVAETVISKFKDINLSPLKVE